MTKPNIGIITDWHESGGYSKFEHFALRTHYVRAVQLTGGVAWIIPYCAIDEIDQYISRIDGLLVPGGFYKTPDDWYVENTQTSPYQPSPRFIFEENFIKKALEKDISLLGICAGMQVLGGVLGCKLTGNIHKYLPKALPHFGYQENHEIIIEKNSLLHKITNSNKISVNSNHNEAIVKISDKVIISAKATDGCIEAIEVKDKKFAIGVQWHPDFSCYQKEQIKDFNPDFELLKEFIKSCK